MPDLDKNYLAGLYLDQITLDVMPQEYIDAALEVKLRRDACAPRAGYNCVQDRRVKGGFYYRKAPQGQGVNALPPSKLERALARSQEQSSAKTEMGFLSKAAIAAGLTVGGLALTGAVVNAGRSSEPFQEPAKPKTTSARTTFNPTSIGVVGAGTIAVGAASLSINKKPVPQNIEIQGESISPVESAQQPAGQNPVPPSKQSPEAAKRKRGQVQASEETPPVTESIETPKEKRNTAPEYVASRVSTLYGGQSTTRNGFEELDTIRSRKALKDYSDEDIDNAIASNPIQKIQVKGKTYIRDLDKVSEGVLINEAVNLRKASSKVNTTDAPEVRRLLEARDRKIANLNKKKDPTPEEKEAVAKLDKAVEEMRTAISDREKSPVRSEKVKPEKKPSAVKEQKEAEKPAIAKSETKADIPPTQKTKKELKEEEAKRLASSIDAIANVNMTAQLRNTKKFPMADQEVFEEKASPEQKAKLSATIGKEIEKLGYDTPEGEELRGLHESLIGKKYVQAKPAESKAGATEKEAASDKKATNKGTPVKPPLAPNLSVENVDFKEPEYKGKEISNLSEAITKAKGSIPILVSQKDPVRYEAQGEISNLITYGASMAKDRDNETVRAFPYVLPKDKDIANAMLRQQDILYREPSDITPALSQSKIRGQASLTSSLDLENLVPTKSIDRYDPKTIESLAQDFTKVGGTIKPIVTIQKDPLTHEIVDGHLQYYAAKKAAEANPQYANIRSYPAEDMNHAEAIVAQYEAVRKAIAETDAVKAAGEKKPRGRASKPKEEAPTAPAASVQELKKSLEQKAKAIADDFNGFNISSEEASKRMRAIEKSQEGKAYLMADPAYKSLSEKVSKSEAGSQERKEASKQLKDRAAQLFSRASVKPPTEASSSGGANSTLSDTQKRNKLASLASKKEAEIKAIRARYGKGGIPRGSSDAATVDQMEFSLERMKKSLGKWDEKIKVAESKTTPQTSNDAIAPSEIYLSAYNETRNKYRRSS